MIRVKNVDLLTASQVGNELIFLLSYCAAAIGMHVFEVKRVKFTSLERIMYFHGFFSKEPFFISCKQVEVLLEMHACMKTLWSVFKKVFPKNLIMF